MTPYTTERISKSDIERSKRHGILLLSATIALFIALVALTIRWHRMDFADRIGYDVGHSEILRK